MMLTSSFQKPMAMPTAALRSPLPNKGVHFDMRNITNADAPLRSAGDGLKRTYSTGSMSSEEGYGSDTSATDARGDAVSLFQTGGSDIDSTSLYRADFRRLPDRINPLDARDTVAPSQSRHARDVNAVLGPIVRAFEALDAPIASARKQGSGPVDITDVYSCNEIVASEYRRDASARIVLGSMGISADVVEDIVENFRMLGVEGIMDACRLLAMPEAKHAEQAQLAASLEQAVKDYIKAAGGDYTGAYKAYSKDASRELEKLQSAVKSGIAHLGSEVVRQRLMTDLAPAVLDVMARKNPGVCLSALRGQLPALLNTQAFSSYRELMKTAHGAEVLHRAELLPQFIQSASAEAQPPAKRTDTPPSRPEEAPPRNPIDDVVRILQALPQVVFNPKNKVGDMGCNSGNGGDRHGIKIGNGRCPRALGRFLSDPEGGRAHSRPERRPEVRGLPSVRRNSDPGPVVGPGILPPMQMDPPVRVTEALIQASDDGFPYPPPPPPPPPLQGRPAHSSTRVPLNEFAHLSALPRRAKAWGEGDVHRVEDGRQDISTAVRTRNESGEDHDDHVQASVRARVVAEHTSTSTNSEDTSHRSYDRMNTPYLAAPNVYMSRAIPPGGTADSRFRWSGGGYRHNVAGAGVVAEAIKEEDIHHVSDTSLKRGTLHRVNKLGADTKPLYNRLGDNLGLPPVNA